MRPIFLLSQASALLIYVFLSRFSRLKEKQVLAQQRLYKPGHVRDPFIDYLVVFARSDREGVSEWWKRVDRFQELCRTLGD